MDEDSALYGLIGDDEDCLYYVEDANDMPSATRMTETYDANAEWLQAHGVLSATQFTAALRIMRMDYERLDVALMSNFSFNEIDGRVTGYVKHIRDPGLATIKQLCSPQRNDPPRISLLFLQEIGANDDFVADVGALEDLYQKLCKKLLGRHMDYKSHGRDDYGISVYQGMGQVMILLKMPMQELAEMPSTVDNMAHIGITRTEYQAEIVKFTSAVQLELQDAIADILDGYKLKGPCKPMNHSIDRFVAKDLDRSNAKFYASDCRIVGAWDDNCNYVVDSAAEVLYVNWDKRSMGAFFAAYATGCTNMTWKSKWADAAREGDDNNALPCKVMLEEGMDRDIPNMVFDSTLAFAPLSNAGARSMTAYRTIGCVRKATLHNYPMSQNLDHQRTWHSRIGMPLVSYEIHRDDANSFLEMTQMMSRMAPEHQKLSNITTTPTGFKFNVAHFQ